jgi:hypothetical protein
MSSEFDLGDLVFSPANERSVQRIKGKTAKMNFGSMQLLHLYPFRFRAKYRTYQKKSCTRLQKTYD